MERKKNDLPIPGRDYCVRMVDLDTKVRGVTAMDDDGFANVYINSRQPVESQYKAFFHELTHIIKDDFSKE